MNFKYEKCIIWDWNGTLFDDSEVCVKAINILAKQFGIGKISKEFFAESMEFPLKNFFVNLGFDLSTVSFDDLISLFTTEYQKYISLAKVRPELEKVISRLYEQNVDMFILSAAPHEYLNKTVEAMGIRKYFKHVLGLPDNRAESKLNNAFSLIHEFNIDTASAVFIGDTFHDFEVARELGVKCILFPSGHCPKYTLIRSGAKVFESSHDLAAYLDMLLTSG